MLRELSGRTHQVATGVCIVKAGDTAAPHAAESLSFVDMTDVTFYELTDEQIEAFAHIEVAGDGTPIDEGLRTIKEYLRHRHGGTRQELAVDYARVFLGAGSYDRILAPPYESVFTSEERILMQDARDGAVTYYRRAGLDLPADNTTPEDHLLSLIHI